ncbi:MAG: pseudouridine synthase [Bacteroidota bacterium]
MTTTYLIYKPYGMLSQFTREVPTHVTLADLDYSFARDVYPVGRLDADSEGLLLLSNDSSLNKRILHPTQKKPKTYLAQVEGQITSAEIMQLQAGVTLRIKGKLYRTLPAKIAFATPPSDLPQRVPPIRHRATIQTSWIEINIIEGKNRQVRKMCAHVGYPVLRLIRVGLMGYRWGEGVLDQMEPGDVVKVKL